MDVAQGLVRQGHLVTPGGKVAFLEDESAAMTAASPSWHEIAFLVDDLGADVALANMASNFPLVLSLTRWGECDLKCNELSRRIQIDSDARFSCDHTSLSKGRDGRQT